MTSLYKTIRPLIFTLPAECAHHMTLRALRLGIVPSTAAINDNALAQTIAGLTFNSPVGLAAGFDKNAQVIAAILKLGFGFTEAGTVTPKPQSGNPKPRIFRDAKNEAVINRMGFPNAGKDIFNKNFQAFLDAPNKPSGIVGINIGMNKEQTKPADDYTILIREFADRADYFTINISSPNTPGLRDLQSREPLLELLNAVTDERANATKQPPIFVKFAPDLDDAKIAELCTAVLEAGIDGVIVGNTTLDRPDALPPSFAAQKGGLSGQPLTQKSTNRIAQFYTHLGGKIPIIGAGGIASAQDAYDKIKAGASLVQIYSGMIYEGPSLANTVNEGLLALLKQDGFGHISEAIGNYHK